MPVAMARKPNISRAKSKAGAAIALLATTLAIVGPALALLDSGPQGLEQGDFRRQVWLIPSPDPAVRSGEA